MPHPLAIYVFSKDQAEVDEGDSAPPLPTASR